MIRTQGGGWLTVSQSRLYGTYDKRKHESPLKAGIIGKAFSLPFNHPVIFIPATALSLSSAAVTLWPLEDVLRLFLGQPSRPLWGLMIFMIMGALGSTILMAAMVKLAFDSANGSKTSLGSLGSSLLLAAKKFPTLIIAQTALILMVGGIVLCPIVAGIPLVTLATIPIAIYVQVRLFFLVQAIMLDGEGVRGAFQRSLKVTKNYALDIFIGLLMIILMLGVINFMAVSIQTAILKSVSAYPAALLIQAIAMPIFVSCQTLIYIHLTKPIPETTSPQAPAEPEKEGPPGCDMKVDCIACPHFTIKGGREYCLRLHRFEPRQKPQRS